MALLGAHVSTAGGPAKAFERGAEIGCESLQIFVKSPSRWRAKPFAKDAIDAFHAARKAAPQPVVAHAAYLINLASPDQEMVEKSRAAVVDELKRCTALGVDSLVVHPGGHKGEGMEAGIERIARSIDAVLGADTDITTKLLLENTAGQGSAIGAAFSELRGILDLAEQGGRVGICLDSCHAFAAGYDIASEEGYRAMLDELGELLGIERLGCIHLNDSQHPLGSRRDRHENIGLGEIGPEFFARIIREPSLAQLPMVLETPLGDDGEGHRNDLITLRGLA